MKTYERHLNLMYEILALEMEQTSWSSLEFSLISLKEFLRICFTVLHYNIFFYRVEVKIGHEYFTPQSQKLF